MDLHAWLQVGSYVAWPLLYWLGKRLLDGAKREIIDEMMERVDKRFIEHEKCDDRLRERLDRIEELLILRSEAKRKLR